MSKATTETPKIARYGSWDSPITAELISKKATSFDNLFVDPRAQTIYHIEKRPTEKGRNVIVLTKTGVDLFPPGSAWNARTGVHEYGGAAAIAYDNSVYFSNFEDGRIYKISGKGEPAPVTPVNTNHRFADFAPHPTNPHILVSILEDHTNPTPSAVLSSLVSIDTKTQTIAPFVFGSDFIASPVFNSDGTLVAWTQWSHPDMPWEGSEVYIASVKVINDEKGDHLVPTNVRKVAGEKGTVSAVEPLWAPNGRDLIFTSDISGFKNLWIASVVSIGEVEIQIQSRPVLNQPVDEDFGEPAWLLGGSSYAILDNSTIIATAFKKGQSAIYKVDVKAGTATLVENNPFVYITLVRKVSANEVVFIGARTDEPKAIVLLTLDPNGGVAFTDLVKPEEEDVKNLKAYFSSPQPISFEVAPGEPLHVVYYAPKNPKYVGEKEEKPPCVVSIHGGPTGMTTQGLNIRQQYFTTRGFAWVDVNYGGSSGYGRKYIDRLVGKWGIVDVADAVQSVLKLSESGLIDVKRAVITGGSAGGYTVLASLACPPPGVKNDVFAAGTSSFGVSDLRKLAEFTHKFESRYLEKLLGGTPEEIPEVYKERSPVFNAERIVSPLLILQGSIDAVVPPEQAEDIVKVINRHQGIVKYVLFEGEGHGWRRADTIVQALGEELSFYKEIFDL